MDASDLLPVEGGRWAIRSAEGFYAGPISPHIYTTPSPPRWLPEPSPFWLFGSKQAAERRIRDRGWPPGFAWVEEVSAS